MHPKIQTGIIDVLHIPGGLIGSTVFNRIGGYELIPDVKKALCKTGPDDVANILIVPELSQVVFCDNF